MIFFKFNLWSNFLYNSIYFCGTSMGQGQRKNRNGRAICPKCRKSMRSDVLARHLMTHRKSKPIIKKVNVHYAGDISTRDICLVMWDLLIRPWKGSSSSLGERRSRMRKIQLASGQDPNLREKICQLIKKCWHYILRDVNKPFFLVFRLFQ